MKPKRYPFKNAKSTQIHAALREMLRKSKFNVKIKQDLDNARRSAINLVLCDSL